MNSFYGTADAAAELGLSVPAIKYHVRQRHLVGRLVGRSLVFTPDDLARFRATRRPRGRPRKETVG